MVSRPPDALQERCDRTRRTELAHQIDVADVDPELERRSRDQHAQFAALQALLRIEAIFFRETAVMRGDRFLAETLGKMARGTFGHTSRVDEYERRPMLRDEFGEAVVHAFPDVV